MKAPGLIMAPGEDPGSYTRLVGQLGPDPVLIAVDSDLPDGVGGLLLVGESIFKSPDGQVPPALKTALEADIPVLGVRWGMQALNVALGGKSPVRLADVELPTPPVGRRRKPTSLGSMRTFLTLGGKVAATIGAGGPVATPGPGEYAIRDAERAPALMASAYDMETGAIEALELPGYHWVIGVTWPLDRPGLVPDRFENILAAFVERSTDD